MSNGLRLRMRSLLGLVVAGAVCGAFQANGAEQKWTPEQQKKMQSQVKKATKEFFDRDEDVDPGPFDYDGFSDCCIERFVTQVPGPATAARLGQAEVTKKQEDAYASCMQVYLKNSTPKRWSPRLLSMFEQECVDRTPYGEKTCACLATDAPKHFRTPAELQRLAEAMKAKAQGAMPDELKSWAKECAGK